MENRLKLVHLQLTKRCNLRCSFCGQWGESGFMRNSEKVRELDFSDWKKVIDSIAAYAEKEKIKPQLILWGGEPLLSPSFANIAVLLKSYGFETGLVTNGTLLDKYAAVINENIDVLYISLDGPEGIHDRIRGQAGTFRKIATGLEAIDSSKVMTVALTTICRDNHDCLVDFPDYVAEKLPGVQKLLYQNIIHVAPEDAHGYATWLESCCNQTPEHIASWINEGFDDYVNELPGIFREVEQGIEQKRYPVEVCITPEGMRSDKIAEWYDLKGDYDGEIRCIMPFSHLHVHSGGNVDMCVDFDDFSAGNVLEKDVMEIFSGSEAEKFRQKFLESPLPICGKCPWRCNRSPGLDPIKINGMKILQSETGKR